MLFMWTVGSEAALFLEPSQSVTDRHMDRDRWIGEVGNQDIQREISEA